ncbi:MAG: hypothetical protein J1F33_02130 [Clostridiales bacterium]|nr:hypothetical protein [Clostridiales bacterium]
MIVGRLLNKIINIFTGLFAIATLILMLVCYIHRYTHVLDLAGEGVYEKIERFRNYFTLATIFCAGIEFTLKRNIILAVIFACIVVAVAVFMIYTDVSYVPPAV